MPVVTLKKENISNNYDIGEHILGRGKELQCTSKKVSRKHGLLKISEQGVYLESTHNNPCFHKPNKVSSVAIIPFGNNIKLANDDQIALCLDHGWFLVQFQQNEINNDNDTSFENALTQIVSNKDTTSNDTTLKCPLNIENENISNDNAPTQPLKRPIEEDDDESPAKKQKSDNIPTENIEIKIEPLEEPCSSNNNSTCNMSIKEEPVDNVPIKTEDESVKEEIKTVDDPGENKDEDKNNNKDCDKANSDKPSTSGTSKKPWRDRCWYGIQCYRKNSNHRVELSHPGDSDYDSDPDDTRPICCYGADCYRKNKDHRKRYRHPGQKKLGTKPPPLPPKRRIRKPVDPLSQDSEELDDDYYWAPFIYDDSEDEYEPSQQTDTESDYEDSQEVAEDNKRLVAEARKFTRNRK